MSLSGSSVTIHEEPPSSSLSEGNPTVLMPWDGLWE